MSHKFHTGKAWRHFVNHRYSRDYWLKKRLSVAPCEGRAQDSLAFPACSCVSIVQGHFEPGQMRRVCGDNAAQNAAGDHVADKMIVHRHKAHEHRSTKNGNYDSTAGRRNQAHRGEAQDPGGVAGRKAADVVATLKRI